MNYEEAHRIFSYDPKTGLLKWRVRTSIRVVVGQVAGTPTEDGRRYVGYLGKRYLTSRVVWLMNTGAWPRAQLDHINRNPSDDRFENLRAATHTENCWNATVRNDSTTGIKGIMKCRDKFQARIQFNKKKIHLGTFDSAEAASAVYQEAARKFHGEFFTDGAE